MLRVFDNIADAIQRSAATAYPLLVIVHDPLPEIVNHAGEALATDTFSFLPATNSATLTDDSFTGSASLRSPATTTMNTSGTGVSTSATAHVDPAATSGAAGTAAANANTNPAQPQQSGEPQTPLMGARVPRSNAENAPLGKLKETLDGPLNPSFPLGRVRGGVAQKEALMVTLLNLRLGNICIAHCIERGTPACENFERAMPSQQQQTTMSMGGGGGGTADTGAPGAPRVHVFPPVFFAHKRRDGGGGAGAAAMPPFVLAGEDLTPAAVHHAVKVCLQIPFAEAVALSGMGHRFASDPRYSMLLSATGGGGGGQPGQHQHDESGGTLLAAVARMNAEARRQAEASRIARETLAARPLLPGGSAPAAVSTATTPATGAATVSIATAATLSNATATPAALALVHIEGLPGTGRTGAPSTRRRAVLIHPTMTARTIWNEVEAASDKGRRDVAAAKAAGEWNGLECTLTRDNFYLTYSSPSGGTADAKQNEEAKGVEGTLHSATSANSVVLSRLPAGTTFYIQRTGEAPIAPPRQSESQPQRPSLASSPKAGAVQNEEVKVVCHGDACHRVSTPGLEATSEAGEKHGKDDEQHKQTQPPSVNIAHEAGKKTEETVTASAAAADSARTGGPSGPTSITLRCALPDGRTEAITGVDIDADSLRARARGPIAAALDTNAFVFILAFPPPARRFSTDEDEAKPLRAIGITASTTLRVVLAGNAKAGSAASGTATTASTTNSGGGARLNGQPVPSNDNSAEKFAVNPADAARASGILAQMMRMLGSANSNNTNATNASAAGGGSASRPTLGGRGPRGSAAEPQARRGGFRTMAEIRAAEEDDERESAREQLRREQLASGTGRVVSHADPPRGMSGEGIGDVAAAMDAFFRRVRQPQDAQHQGSGDSAAVADADGSGAKKKKKSTRYFGGASTEFISAPMDEDEDEGDKNDGSGHGPSHPAQPAFTGVGRRLADGAPAAQPQPPSSPTQGEGEGQEHSEDAKKKHN